MPQKIEQDKLRAPIVTEEAVIYGDNPERTIPAKRQPENSRTPQMQGDCGDVFRSWAHR